MPALINFILILAALGFILSGAIPYFQALSTANGLNFLRWNSIWKSGKWKPLPEQAVVRYRLFWLAATICWITGAEDWRWRVVFGVLALFFVAILIVKGSLSFQGKSRPNSPVERGNIPAAHES